MANHQQTLDEKLSAADHVRQAERYANCLPAMLELPSARAGLMNQTDVALADVYLHAADVHLKLAEVKRAEELRAAKRGESVAWPVG